MTVRTCSVVSWGRTTSSAGMFSSLVWLMNSMALTRFMSFSLMSVEYLANFTRSAVRKSARNSSSDLSSATAISRSIISLLVISMALKP